MGSIHGPGTARARVPLSTASTWCVSKYCEPYIRYSFDFLQSNISGRASLTSPSASSPFPTVRSASRQATQIHPQLNPRSVSSLRSPAVRLPNPDTSARAPLSDQMSPFIVAHDVSRSPSLASGTDLDHDIGSVSSRPDSPFSVFSAPRSTAASNNDQPSMSQMELLSVSDDDLDVSSVHSSASSHVYGDERTRDAGSVWSWASSVRSR